MNAWLVSVAALSQVASYAGSGYLLKSLVNLSGQKLSIWRGGLITIASSSLGTTFGGQFATSVSVFHLLRRAGVRTEGALTLDEFALWLNLRDVYWAREGRESIDAVILFGSLLLVGFWGGPFFHALWREFIRLRRRQVGV
jgi:hypothetical protein